MYRKKFAFVIHPRVNIAEDMARIWRPFGRIPESVYDVALRQLPVPPITWNTVYLQDEPDEPAGWIILAPLGARQMLNGPRDWVTKKVGAAVDKAVKMGAEVVGLGALTAPVTKGGMAFQSRRDIGVTNGNAFTAYMTYEGMERLVEERLGPDATIAVVGATGSVGQCVVQLAARQQLARRFILVARNQERLDQTAERVRAETPGLQVETATDMAAVREADLIVLLTSATENLLRSEHLKPGAIVLDDTQPRNTDPAIQQERPDVVVLDGGIVHTPGIRREGGNIDLPKDHSFACLSEAILLALSGHEGHFSLGKPTVDQAAYVGMLARAHRHFGFSLAPFHSFGKPVETWPRRAAVPFAVAA